MPWELKLVDDVPQLSDDGKPIYIDPEGKEVALDAPQMYDKIINLGKENKKRREAAETAQNALKLFDGIEDLEAWHKEATKAMETVKNFNDKEWLQADKVEKMKKEMKESYEDKENQLKKSFGMREEEFNGVLSRKEAQIRSLMVSNKFATHPFFSGTNPKTTLLPDMAESYFGKYFKVEENDKTGELRLIAYNNGDPLYSRANPGEVADFDEAMNQIWEAYPGKDNFIRTTTGGSGGRGGSGSGEEGTTLQALEKQYEEAKTKNNASAMLTLKNKIHAERMKQRQAGNA